MRGFRRVPGFPVIVVLVGCLLAGGLAHSQGNLPPLRPPVEAGGGELLFSDAWLETPTQTSAGISVVPTVPLELLAEYARADGSNPTISTLVTGPADSRLALRLRELTPGAEYMYRLRYRPRAKRAAEHADSGWTVGEWQRLQLPRLPGSTYAFAFATDSHILNRWIGADCGRDPRGIPRFRRTLHNVADAGVDFLILGGDEVMTHGLRRRDCRLSGEPMGYEEPLSPRQAHLRYRVFRHLFDPVAASMPVFLVLGNHDGEAPFGGEAGACGHSAPLAQASRSARLAHLANPFPVYGGDPNGGYYAFSWGDALIVVLDVMGHVTKVPASAADWTLGAEQLQWLEQTLSRSQHTWKLVFAHHLLGGLAGRAGCYHYGRGGAFTTIDGTLEAPFLGEQEQIDRLLRKHKAQALFHGHDHLFSAAAKPSPADPSSVVHYVCGGVSAGPAAVWKKHRWVTSGYGKNANGDNRVIHGPGYVRVEVRGAAELVIQYIRSDPWDPDRNGKVLAEIVVPGPSRRAPGDDEAEALKTIGDDLHLRKAAGAEAGGEATGL